MPVDFEGSHHGTAADEEGEAGHDDVSIVPMILLFREDKQPPVEERETAARYRASQIGRAHV